MSILEQAKKPAPRPVVVTLLGDAGMGKTSLAATFPNPVVVRVEDGVQGVPEKFRPDALPVVKTVEQLWEQLNALVSEKHDYKTVIIDSITQLEAIFEKHVVDGDPKRPRTINQANGGYGAGWVAVGNMHQRVRAAATALVERGVNVVFIAHADRTVVSPPDGDEYTRYDLRLNKRSVSPYTDNVDLIGYLALNTYTKGDGERKQAVSDGTRKLVCYPTPSNISKNRYGITDDIDVKLGVNPLKSHIKTLQETK